MQFHPLTPERWSDFETLFGTKGACTGCWCMHWRQRGKVWETRTNEGNKAQFRAIVAAGPPPGILAYVEGIAVGWCQVGPHQAYDRFVHSRTKQPLDDKTTWVINCFYIAKDHRKTGLTPKLITAAVAFAKKHGAQRVEGFPIAKSAHPLPAPFAFVGTPSSFERAGFRAVRRKIGNRFSTRYCLDL